MFDNHVIVVDEQNHEYLLNIWKYWQPNNTTRTFDTYADGVRIGRRSVTRFWTDMLYMFTLLPNNFHPIGHSQNDNKLGRHTNLSEIASEICELLRSNDIKDERGIQNGNQTTSICLHIQINDSPSNGAGI